MSKYGDDIKIDGAGPIEELFDFPLDDVPDEDLDVPMFDQPGRTPGRADPCFSPLQLFAMTQIERTDVDGSDDAIWLKTERRDTVSDEGIELHGRQYTDDALMPYITKGVPANRRPQLAIRYNAALAARRVLDEVRVYEITATGAYEEIARCRTREQYLASMDMNNVSRLQNDYLRIIGSQRSKLRNTLIEIQDSQAAVQRLEQKAAARWRAQAKVKHEPIVSRPIRADEKPSNPDDKHAALQEALRQSEQTAATDPADEAPPVDRARHGRKGSGRPKKAGAGLDLSAAPPLPQPAIVPDPTPVRVNLGRELGGTVGFSTPTDDEDQV
jgi:hypothetical protein